MWRIRGRTWLPTSLEIDLNNSLLINMIVWHCLIPESPCIHCHTMNTSVRLLIPFKCRFYCISLGIPKNSPCTGTRSCLPFYSQPHWLSSSTPTAAGIRHDASSQGQFLPGLWLGLFYSCLTGFHWFRKFCRNGRVLKRQKKKKRHIDFIVKKK